MGLFKALEGDSAVVVENGVYKQVPIYTRDGYLYGNMGGGFVRLNLDGSTSKPKCRLDYLDTTAPLGVDKMGRLCLPSERSGAISLDPSSTVLLAGKKED